MSNITNFKRENGRKPKKSRTGHMTDREKFEYYYNLRMSLLKSALRGVGNLSNSNVYDIPDKAKEVISTKLRKWSKEYVYVCEKIAYHHHNINEHVDIGFTDAQKYFNVYTFDQPLFFQTSSNGTNQKLTSYPTHECFTHMKSYWLPTQIY